VNQLEKEGQEIKQHMQFLIQQSGESYREVSLSIGKTGNYMHELLKGEGLPSMGSFLDFCKHFKISPRDFFSFCLKPTYDEQLVCELKRLLGEDYDNLVDILRKINPRDYLLIKNLLARFFEK